MMLNKRKSRYLSPQDLVANMVTRTKRYEERKKERKKEEIGYRKWLVEIM